MTVTRLDRRQLALLLAGVTVVTAAAVASRLTGTTARRELLDNVHWTVAYLVAAAVAWLGFRAAEGEVRRARGWFVLGLCANAAGQIVWNVQQLVGWYPFPGPADIGYVLLGPAFIVGFLVHVRGLTPGERSAIVLDVLGMAFSVLALVLLLYLPHRGDLDTFTTAVVVAYPVFDIDALGVLFVVTLAMRWRVDRGLALMGVSMLACGLAWMEWNRLTLEDGLVPGTFVNLVFSCAMLGLGGAVAIWNPQTDPSARWGRVSGAIWHSAPLVLVCGAAAASALQARVVEPARPSVVLCVLAVLVVAALRQSLLLRERERLLLAEQRARESEARRRELETRLAAARRLEALGTLASGIAHDFNNILMAVAGHAHALSELDSLAAPDRESARAIGTATERGRDLVRRMLAFARQQESEQRPVVLAEVVEETLRLARSALPATIAVESRLDAGLPPVLGDASQLHQVMMNLVTNAAHAIGERQGAIRVRLRRGALPAAHPAAGSEAVVLDVSDDGCGMDEATRRRIFEPFFTTKGPQEGTGLGLSVVHGVVTSHGGAIAVESEPGRGTTFILWFPAHVETVARDPTPAPRERLDGAGRELLLVDDEPMVAASARRMLTRQGWKVELAGSGEEALALVRQGPTRFTLVITDLTMPGMSGQELAAQLAELTPGLPVVLSSGAGVLPGAGPFVAVLPKPYDFQTLEEVLRRALELSVS